MKENMEKDLKNNLVNKVNMSENLAVNHYMQEGIIKTNDIDDLDSTRIFLSYCWSDAPMADKIDDYLTAYGIKIKRDIRDIGTWKNIRDFLISVGKQDFVIMLISDDYLKSRNSMFDALEVIKDPQFSGRIFPAVMETKIYEPIGKSEYITYWRNKCDVIHSILNKIDMVNAVEIIADLKQTQKIASAMGEFLAMVAGMNKPNNVEIKETIVNVLKEKNLL